MAPSLQVKAVRVPAWMTKGIDLTPYINDAFESIARELVSRHQSAKGETARKNVMTASRTNALNRTLRTTRRSKRVSGGAWTRKQGSRFRGMAGRVVNKYIVKPLLAKWAA